jgi:hypothetical protein
MQPSTHDVIQGLAKQGHKYAMECSVVLHDWRRCDAAVCVDCRAAGTCWLSPSPSHPTTSRRCTRSTLSTPRLQRKLVSRCVPWCVAAVVSAVRDAVNARCCTDVSSCGVVERRAPAVHGTSCDCLGAPQVRCAVHVAMVLHHAHESVLVVPATAVPAACVRRNTR